MKMNSAVRSALTCALFAAATLTIAAQTSAPYHVIDKWKIGGEGGWDYVFADGPAHKLYLSHETRVEVVDTETGKVVGAITGLKRTHGIAVGAGNFGYITDSGTNTVTVFDRTSFAVIEKVAVGEGADAILFEPTTKTIWSFNGRSKTATVLDDTTHKALATVALPGRPEAPAADGNGIIYDNLENTNQLVRIDAKSYKVTDTWNLPGCEGPTGIGFDGAKGRVFSTCDGNYLAVTDAKTGAKVGSAKICDGPDAGDFDMKDKLVFASCGDGFLSVVDASGSDFKTIESIATQKGGRTMSYDATKDRVYVVVAEYGPKPAPTTEVPKPRAPIVAGSFSVVVVGR